MLGKRSEQEVVKTGNLNTIIGKGSTFEGTMKVEESLRVDGKIKGTVVTTDSIIIGKEGDIEGDVTAKNVVIGGRVKANVNATGKVVLEARAIFIGEMKTTRLVIDEGAVFDGQCSMRKETKPLDGSVGPDKPTDSTYNKNKP
ncbi:polymer-forming cytoskeletal protein [candidate division KSB1 bacterium]|nr:polymer-forming cytoskeletal protein [candidate division KSB1 bacterium]